MAPAAPDEAASRYVQRFQVLSEAAGFAPAPSAFNSE
jgi:hypothetical protein